MKTFQSVVISLLLLIAADKVDASVIDEAGPVKAIIFEQDFESPLSELGIDRWEGVSPAWSIEPSEIKGLVQKDTKPVTRQIIYLPGLEWSDYSVLCRLRVVRWGGQTKNFAWSGKQYRRVYWSVAVRVKDAANGYRLEYVPWLPEDGGYKQSFYRLVKYTRGARTELARVMSSFHSDLDHLVRVDAKGKELRVKVWQAGDQEPETWTMTARDPDHSNGTLSFLTANCSVIFGDISVFSSPGRTKLLEEDFQGSPVFSKGWKVCTGQWKTAPWGQRLVRKACDTNYQSPLIPARVLPLPAEIGINVKLNKDALLRFDIISAKDPAIRCLLDLTPCEAALYDRKGRLVTKKALRLKAGEEYRINLVLEGNALVLTTSSYPLKQTDSSSILKFNLPDAFDAVRFGMDPRSSPGVVVDDLVCKATVSLKKALEEYLRYICDWYMSLDLPSGYPKTGSGSPELFIASYCTRTLMAGAKILDEPAYLEEALRWADYVCNSPSVLVPVVTGKGNDAIALRTFADWSACINMADIGSVLFGVGVLCPWADDIRRARYLEVMEKYSLYVTEGCLEDPLILRRGYRPEGWRVVSGPDKGGIINGYWWMDKSEEPWDISTTNAGLQFYSILYRLTGNECYRRYALEATNWYLNKEVDTGAVFENFHDVIYGGEALITAYEHSADKATRARIEESLGKICKWIVEHQNPDGTWNQEDTPRNNRTNLVWHLLDWYAIRHPEQTSVRNALIRTVMFHLDRRKSWETGVCEVLRKTCFTGASVADLIKQGITIELKGE